MLDQKRCDNHPNAVVHDAGVPEFAHACIDDWIAGLTALPFAQGFRIAPPWKCVERRLQIFLCKLWKIEQQVTREFAPAEFAQEFPDVTRDGGSLCRGEVRRIPDLPWTDFAKP